MKSKIEKEKVYISLSTLEFIEFVAFVLDELQEWVE